MYGICKYNSNAIRGEIARVTGILACLWNCASNTSAIWAMQVPVTKVPTCSLNHPVTRAVLCLHQWTFLDARTKLFWYTVYNYPFLLDTFTHVVPSLIIRDPSTRLKRGTSLFLLPLQPILTLLMMWWLPYVWSRLGTVLITEQSVFHRKRQLSLIVICYLRCMHIEERVGHGDCITTCMDVAKMV